MILVKLESCLLSLGHTGSSWNDRNANWQVFYLTLDKYRHSAAESIYRIVAFVSRYRYISIYCYTPSRLAVNQFGQFKNKSEM